ncbi:hypothetical protein D9M68_226420 [compost metagenome]
MSTYPLTRRGDGCTYPKTFNSSTGACVLPTVPQGQLCADQSGATQSNPKISDGAGNCVTVEDADKPTFCKYLASISSSDYLNIRQQYDPETGSDRTPESAVNGFGCEVAVVKEERCVQPPASCSNGLCLSKPAVCTVEVRLTGNVGASPGADRPQDSTCLTPGDPACNPPEPQQTEEKTPCVYATNPDGTQACASEVWSKKDGIEKCGSVNGEWKCFKGSDPKAEGVKVDTTVKTEATPDGGTKTTKIDKMTETTCGATKASCTSTSSSSTTVIIKNGAGETTAATGTCTGPHCPDKNGNPDGDGDGFGDCTGGQCGEGEGGAGDWYEPGEDTYASVMGEFTNRMLASSVVSGIDNFLTLNPSGVCPVYNIDVWFVQARLDQWCGTAINWDFIKAIILAAAAMIAFRIAFL